MTDALAGGDGRVDAPQEPSGIRGVWDRLSQHGELLARHDAQIQALEASTARLEVLISDTRTELKAEMGRGFDRLAVGLDRIETRTLDALSPAAAQELAATRNAEGRARAYVVALLAALMASFGVIASLAHVLR